MYLGVFGAFFALLGLLMLRKPDCFWLISEKWKSDSADGPSDLYIFSTKIGGIILLVVGAFFLFMMFLYGMG